MPFITSPVQPYRGSIIDRAHPQLRGCLAWWPMWEGTGGRITDLVRARVADQTGMTLSSMWQPGRSGHAIQFDGSNDLISTPTTDWPTGNSGVISTCCWVNPTALTAIGIFVGVDLSWMVRQEGSDVFLRTFGGSTNAGGSPLSVGKWTHVAVVWKVGDMATFFIDGIRKADTAIADTSSTAGEFTIGGRDSASEFFAGYLDDIRLYNRVLSNAEIQDIMHNPWAPILGWGDDADLVRLSESGAAGGAGLSDPFPPHIAFTPGNF